MHLSEISSQCRSDHAARFDGSASSVPAFHGHALEDLNAQVSAMLLIVVCMMCLCYPGFVSTLYPDLVDDLFDLYTFPRDNL